MASPMTVGLPERERSTFTQMPFEAQAFVA